MWSYVPLEKVANICDELRKPVNSKERAKRIEGKLNESLFPYYGATGQVGYIDDYLTDGEYVLLGEDGAPFLNPFASKAYIISGKAWVNNHAHILQSKSNNKFLCYYLNYFDYNSYVSGTTRLKLTQAQLKRIEIPDISKDEQQRIVSCIEELFSELDKGVETLQTIKEQLAVYRQAVLKEALNGIKGQPYTVKDVCKEIKVGIVIKPSQYYTDEQVGIKAFRSANVREFHVEDKNWAYLSIAGHQANARSIVHTGDILIVRSGYPGTACVVPEQFNGCNAIDILIAVPNRDLVLPEFLCAYTNSPLGKKFVNEKKRGVGQKHFNVSGYSKMLIPVPSLDKQEEIVKKIASRLSVCDSIERTVNTALAQAEAMRQSILKKAFEGELCK
ncbi:restriction endonuclease subunit S [Gemmiger formicilis]|uniref:restriction endonuclease subunit S n=1 Tax=Gemmiger formicilis TaxID=745368 RepID=UPI003CEBF159